MADKVDYVTISSNDGGWCVSRVKVFIKDKARRKNGDVFENDLKIQACRAGKSNQIWKISEVKSG